MLGLLILMAPVEDLTSNRHSGSVRYVCTRVCNDYNSRIKPLRYLPFVFTSVPDLNRGAVGYAIANREHHPLVA